MTNQLSDTPAPANKVLAEAGRFIVVETPDGGLGVEGPGDYMDAKGTALLAAIAADQDPMFPIFMQQSGTLERALAVRFQTDYAGWKGTKDFLDAHGPR